ncbi:MAG: DUF1559 domain-containing protein [Planctomycetia bacterium]|nr:DUF1559 domain-containing protein [Planctomycetia bacterium]
MWRWIILSLLLLTVIVANQAQEKSATSKAWTYAKAMELYNRSPRDSYLQYVALQTARREKTSPDHLQSMQWRLNRMGRREGVDLFNTFSGALAVQESLQLDTMLDQPENQRAFARPAPTKEAIPDTLEKEQPPEKLKKIEKVKVASLQGPTIKSHPWETMLAGRKPEIGELALCVPEDFYFIEFPSAAKLMETLKTTNLWSGHLLAQMLGASQSQDVEKRIKTQLGIQGIPPALIDAMGLKGIAVAGSDLYLADGSDITLLVKGEQLLQLRNWTDGALANKPGIEVKEGQYLGVPYQFKATQDRQVHVYTADPLPDLHVRSNSLPAFKKVLAAIQGKDDQGNTVTRLGDTQEFKYIRTILPKQAKEEDGLVYLSDPFIRRLLGPRVKLTQQHRLRAFNHLKMIEKAALMFKTEQGRSPQSLEELHEKGCAPGIFGQGKWACPAGGNYLLSEDKMSAISSVFGRPTQLTPLLEIPLEEVSQADAQAYQSFLQEYNQYWRTFFDPIAVRIKVTPEQFRLETVVLPLIDNSIYTGMAQALGGKPVPFDAISVPPRTIHSFAGHINKDALLPFLPGEEVKTATPSIIRESNLRQVLIAMHNYHGDYNHMPSRAIFSKKDKKPLLSWRVQLLPYLEHDNLYKEFKLDEPWDSEHNKKLISRMPKIYSSGKAELDKEFKTRLQVPVHEKSVFPLGESKLTLGQITVGDGTSNTIGLLEVASSHAVIWTKPDDLNVDLTKPLEGIIEKDTDEFLVAACDGSIYRLKNTIPVPTMSSLIQWRDGIPVSFGDPVAQNQRMRNPLAEIPNLNMPLLRDFLTKGIGDQITYHVLDASQPINAEVSGFLGALSTMGEMAPRTFGAEMIVFGMLGQSLTNPACMVIPVNHVETVDRFLSEVDQRLAEIPKHIVDFLRTEQYQIKQGEHMVRVYGIKVLGFSFRVAWARFGQWLVFTNHPALIEELAQHYSHVQPARIPTNAIAGHAQFRIRPEAWNAVLSGYRLGWAENHRSACEVNQQQIANVAMAYPELLNAQGEATEALLDKVYQVYGSRPYCPDGGKYRYYSSNHSCECSIHGNAVVAPRQLLGPATDSETARTIAQFKGMSATLTFLEDGLHAVVTIDRK